MSLIKPLSPALPAWFLGVSFSLFPNVDKVIMRQLSPNQGYMIRHELVSIAVLQHVEFKNNNIIFLSLFNTRLLSTSLRLLSITPPHRHHHITPTFLSNPYGCHSLHWLSSNRQVHFQPSPVPPFCPPHLSILQYSLASPPLLCLPSPHQSPLWQVSSLSLSISAIFLLSIERRSYFIGSACCARGYHAQACHFKIWYHVYAIQTTILFILYITGPRTE